MLWRRKRAAGDSPASSQRDAGSCRADQPAEPEAANAYLDSVLERFAGWVQYGDTKVGFVLVVLGLGLANLADASGSLIDADTASRWGLVASGSYWLAHASAVLAVFYLGATVLPYAPRPDSDGKQRLPWPKARSLWFRFWQGDKVDYEESVYYFRDVASRKSADIFHEEVKALTSEKLVRHKAYEVYGLAKIAEMKVARTKWALIYSACFLLLWLIAKTALALGE